ncbi:Ribonuclease 1 [Glycine max]|nr:Ribonuclease 1 [Glycine max]
MKSKFLFVFLLLGILNCEAQYFNANPYDYLQLALRWPNSYCLTHEGGCREIVPQYFTISYLHPMRRGGPDLQNCPSPFNMPNSTMEINKNDLLKYWPDLRTDNFIESKSLWRDQWRKFGSCYSMMPDDYIVYALNSRKRNDLKKILTNAGIVASGNPYPTRRILQAFRKALGVNVDIVCEPDRSGNVYLAEVHQCVDAAGTTSIDCDNKARGCDDDPIFPYMGFQPDKDPNILLVLLLMEILNCEAQYFDASPYDYLELALRWPNSYCLTHEDGCREIVPQYFTISYFRPRKLGGPDLQYCPTPITLSNNIIETNKYDLLRFWPDLRTDNFIESKSLWRDQWKKFGSCCFMMPDDYFVYALNNRKRYDLKRILTSAGIVANGNSYPTYRILQIFKKTLGLNVSIVCESDRSGNVYLAEVHQCVDISGTMPITQYFNANPYDYLQLALRWPNSYCLTHEGGCREIVPQYFTISYLHPMRRGGPDLQNCPSPFNMPNSTMETNKNDLLKYWPDLRTDNFIESKSLWRDQWRKFGSCYSMMPDDYIVYALNSRKRNDLKKILTSAGIVASGNPYPTRRILQAFRKALGVNVDIVCEPDRSGNVYLAEVHQCVDAAGTTAIDCDNKARGCDDDPIFPYMGFQPDKDPK